MAEIQVHIERMLSQCRQLQENGHLEHIPDGYVAVSDIEIKINDLKEAVEQHIENGGSK